MRLTRLSTWLIVSAPLPAIAIGCLVAARYGISPKAFLPNVVGVIIGIPLAVFGSSRLGSLIKRYPSSTAFVLLLLFASTLLFPGVANVRRWIPLGPVRLNVSMVLAPVALFALYVALEKGTSLAAITIMAALAVHILQPDAGQAIAFAAAAGTLFLLAAGVSSASRLLGILTALGIVILTMLRPDPLAAVPQVEQILHLAVGVGSFVAIATLLAILALFAPLVWAVKTSAQLLAVSFAVYFIAAFLVTEGNFPVPVVGAGASAVLGWYLMIGLTVQEGTSPELRRG